MAVQATAAHGHPIISLSRRRDSHNRHAHAHLLVQHGGWRPARLPLSLIRRLPLLRLRRRVTCRVHIIEPRWVSQPLAFAGGLRPPRHNLGHSPAVRAVITPPGSPSPAPPMPPSGRGVSATATRPPCAGGGAAATTRSCARSLLSVSSPRAVNLSQAASY
jgi:hypothetical protein